MRGNNSENQRIDNHHGSDLNDNALEGEKKRRKVTGGVGSIARTRRSQKSSTSSQDNPLFTSISEQAKGNQPEMAAQIMRGYQPKLISSTGQHQSALGTIRSNANQRQSSNAVANTFFKPHLRSEEIQSGLDSGVFFKAAIRINQRNHEEAFVNNPEGSEFADIFILGMADRNRALQGDVVAARIKPRFSWVVNEGAYKSWKRKSCRREGFISALNKHTDVEETITDVGLADFDDEDLEEVSQISVQAPLPEVEEKSRVLYEDEGSIRKQVREVLESITAAIDYELRRQLNEISMGSGDSIAMENFGMLTMRNEKKKQYVLLNDLPLEEWSMPDECLQKTAEVVGIIEQKNTRLAMGRLEASMSTQRKWAKFSPSDPKMPRMMIDSSQLPKDFWERPQDFAMFIFLARIVEWTDNSVMARGSLEKQLGPAGDVDAETEGLLEVNGVDTREFSDEVMACLPSIPEGGWKISDEEINKRRDFRSEITFTIDPKTARDLDDALSIKQCDDVDGCGNPGWEVGVHIADVSYFVHENTVLDEWTSSRATSVYLVHKVIPMLPRLLCEELCSLNAGVDRLTFSVIFKMDDKGQVHGEWFGRTIIRSRVKLTYEHVQDFIENPGKDFKDVEMPEMSDGVTVWELKEKVLQLHAIAKALRSRRREHGSLQLNQPKLKFALDDDNKSPIGVSIYEVKDSNRLVEEFMLLANMAVARKIERHFQKTALLRCHPPPKAKVLRDARSRNTTDFKLKLCNTVGFPIDGTTSQQLSSALAPYRTNSRLMTSINQVLSMVLMRAMELARYFCTGCVDSQDKYHHYALNVPFYTHFTSPIRRYPDIIVHRLLAASLKYCEPSERTPAELEKIAEHCNDKKLLAKKVSEASDELFFGLLVQRVGPMEAKGVVVNVLDASFDVLLFRYGAIKRVYVKSLDLRELPIYHKSSSRLTLRWSTDEGPLEQEIQMCTVVDVVLSGLSEPTKFEAVIKPKPTNESPTLVELFRKMESTDGAVIDEIDRFLLK